MVIPGRQGDWRILSRGTDPKAGDPWIDRTASLGENPDLQTVLSTLFRWQDSNQHVRVEWVPLGVELTGDEYATD